MLQAEERGGAHDGAQIVRVADAIKQQQGLALIGARLVDRYGKSVHLPGPFSSAFRDEAVQVLATAALSPG